MDLVSIGPVSRRAWLDWVFRRLSLGVSSSLMFFSVLLSCVDVGLAQAEVARATHSDLEQRLHAPCCRGQPLEGHESEPARALRREIGVRLNGGEAAALIEADLIRRYGESIVAIPADQDPRGGLSVLLIVVLVLAFTVLLVVALRWARRARSSSGLRSSLAPNDELDAKLDAELRRLDV